MEQETILKHFSCLPNYSSCLMLMQLFEGWAELASFLRKHYFYLKEQLTDSYGYSDFGIWNTFFFFLMNKVSLSAQGIKLAVFAASDNICAFMRKLEFWKPYIGHCWVCSLTIVKTLTDFDDNINDVLYYGIKCVNI